MVSLLLDRFTLQSRLNTFHREDEQKYSDYFKRIVGQEGPEPAISDGLNTKKVSYFFVSKKIRHKKGV